MDDSVVLSPAATRDLDRLPAERRTQVIDALRALGSDPKAPGLAVKQLRGFRPPLLRLRSGDYRVLFRVVGRALHVYRVIDRKDLERTLRKMR